MQTEGQRNSRKLKMIADAEGGSECIHPRIDPVLAAIGDVLEHDSERRTEVVVPTILDAAMHEPVEVEVLTLATRNLVAPGIHPAHAATHAIERGEGPRLVPPL